ncbi:MAG TPA: serine/threonine-protein kinase, partial [Lacipirellulaceae bacterium]|nr:serine/threonine-protein kinase [Lacipirellulaceae bacterium]
DYELLERIGEGGMGVVYTARQASIDRTVAIKMLKPDFAADIEQRQKFLSEAVVTGDLDHPNIVPIYDLGSNEAGALFYSMKRVRGTPWLDVLLHKSLPENLEILMKVADAVAFAHSRGVVHRDLKPENVMLGDFGEVLVMDWGLALSTTGFRKSDSITQSNSMGGTPAYMAPEMATGPIERVGLPSDIYLLGAILFEIITGKPPHTGRDVMSCLFAAARNQIQSTEHQGELLNLALEAMHTDPRQRFATVQIFQSAIRQYQSHSESIVLSSRAEHDLTLAASSNDYQDFSRALFGFQEAAALWDGNTAAHAGLSRAKLAYASAALQKGDLDLGDSLLDKQHPDHIVLGKKIQASLRERNARQQRLKQIRRIAVVLALAFCAVGVFSYLEIRDKRDIALQAEEQATLDRDRAISAEIKARDAATAATKESERARSAQAAAVASADEAMRAQMKAVEAAVSAQRAKDAEEYEAYVAEIGLAAARIDENAFDSAALLLEKSKRKLRHWEWGRLMHLCGQSVRTFKAHGPVDAVTFAPDGLRFATGSWDSTARIWNTQTGEMLLALPHEGLYVHAVAFSPDGKFLATGSSDKTGFVQI